MTVKFESKVRDCFHNDPETKRLYFDGLKFEHPVDVSCLKNHKHIQKLYMNATGMTEVPKFPEGLDLEFLAIGENKVASTLGNLTVLKKLRRLSMNAADIKSVDQLKPLAVLKDLKHLELIDSPITESNKDYDKEIFKILPQLADVDFRKVSGEDADSGSDESFADSDLYEFQDSDTDSETSAYDSSSDEGSQSDGSDGESPSTDSESDSQAGSESDASGSESDASASESDASASESEASASESEASVSVSESDASPSKRSAGSPKRSGSPKRARKQASESGSDSAGESS